MVWVIGSVALFVLLLATGAWILVLGILALQAGLLRDVLTR